MPITGQENTGIYGYPMPARGVNFYSNIVELGLDECLYSQNMIYRNGMVKRDGTAKFEADEVSTGKKIIGLHRFYYSTASKQLLVASGTVVKYHDGTTWQNVKTGLTDGLQTYFATWLNKAYIANGTDAPHKWDGSSSSAVSAAPADTRMFLPYQDRLLSITGGDLTWSGAFDDTTWGTVANIGVRPDTQLFGMIQHSITGANAGYESKVLLAGANGMYLFGGSDLRWPATTGNYTIYPLATNIGCNAPRTMVWTPKGTLYLGIDRQVYLLPFDSATPIPVGTKIQSSHVGVEGIEKIPATQIANACAVYHDGYYILSIAQQGQTKNNIQFWLDIKRLYQDEAGLWGPWFGPMKGKSFSCFAVQSGNGDSGELMAGSGDATVGSYVYEHNKNGEYGDDGTAIDCQFQTFYHPIGDPAFLKDVHRMEVELFDVLGSVTVDFHDIEGAKKTGDTVSLSGSAIYFDDAYWDEQFFSSSMPTRVQINISPAIKTRRLSLIVKNATTTDKFELYALRVKAIEQSMAFDE